MLIQAQLLLLVMTHTFVCMSHEYTPVKELEPRNFIIYGPGLDSTVDLPVRYIFIQVADAHKNNITQLDPTEIFQINHQVLVSAQFLYAQTNSPITNHIQSEVLYIQRGVFVVRFRIHRSLIKQSIKIKLYWLPTNSLIGSQSVVLEAPLYSDDVYCPRYSLSDWLNTKLKCPSSYLQIDEDFSHFISDNMNQIDPDAQFKQFESQYSSDFSSVAVCRYKIVHNNIYRKCFGEHTDFRIFVEDALITLIKKVRLPYLDFLFNLGDWPLSHVSDDRKNEFIIMSWCGSTDTRDIVLPTYEMMEWVVGMMKSVSLDIFAVLQETSYFVWEKRQPIAFWRGRDSSHERLKLVKMSHKNDTGLVDARLTAMFFFPNSSVEEVGFHSEHVSFIEFFHRKFLVHLDGTVAAYRLPLSLAGGSLILKQKSPYYEYFHSPSNPNTSSDQLWWSLSEDISDLNATLHRALSSDKKAFLTAQRAVKFVHENLMPHHVWCYYGRVWEKLAKVTKQQRPSLDELKKDGFKLVFDTSKHKLLGEDCVYENDYYNMDKKFHSDRSDL